MVPTKDCQWHGFDWLRVFFTSFVIGMHLNLAGAFTAGRDLSWGDVMLADLFSIAVPGFLIMSYFLQIVAEEDVSTYAMRLRRFAALYVFWVGLWFLWIWRGRDSVMLAPVEFILRGGGWTFYFFTVLLLLCPLARLAGAMTRRTAFAWALVFLLLSGVVLVAMSATGWVWTSVATYWWPFNFLAAPFFAKLPAERKWIVGALAVAFLAAAGLEWFAKAPDWLAVPGRHFLPEYFRPSPMLGAALAVAVALGVTRVPPLWIRFLSRNSLGIFCLHCFCLKRIVELTAEVTRLDARWAAVVALPVTLFAMALASELLRRLFRERLV